MTRVFRVSHDSSFDSLRILEPNDFLTHDRNGVPVFAGFETSYRDWPRPNCEWAGLKTKKPTFPFFAKGAIAMSSATFDACEEVFSHAGIQLGLTVSGENWIVLNVTDICNALDRRLSQFRDPDEEGTIVVSKYVIRTARINENVFKLPETATSEVLTYTKSDRPAEFQLKKMYDLHAMTGLIFEEVETV